MTAEAELVDYSRYGQWAPTELRSTLTDSGYSLGLDLSSRATKEQPESGRTAGKSPRSPRLSLAISGRAGLLANVLMNSQNPDIKSASEIAAKVKAQQREMRLLGRDRGRLAARLGEADSSVEQLEEALARLRTDQLALRAAIKSESGEEARKEAEAAEAERLRREALLSPRTRAAQRAEAERVKKAEVALKIRPLLKALGIPDRVASVDASWRRRAAHVFGSINSDNSGGFTAEQLNAALQKGGKYLNQEELEAVMAAFEEGLHSSAAQAIKREDAEVKRGVGRRADQMVHAAAAAEKDDGTISFEEFIYAIDAAIELQQRRRTPQRVFVNAAKKIAAEELLMNTVLVNGLVGELEKMENLIERFSAYGHVRAVTVGERRESQKACWSFVTFDEKASVGRALADDSLTQENLKVSTIDLELVASSTEAMQAIVEVHKKKLSGINFGAAGITASLRGNLMKSTSASRLLKAQSKDTAAAAGLPQPVRKSASMGTLAPGLNLSKTAAVLSAERQKAKRLLSLEQKQKWALARAEKHEEARAVTLSAAAEAVQAAAEQAAEQAALARRREEVVSLGGIPLEDTHIPLANPERKPKNPNKPLSPNEATARNALAFFSPTSFLYTGSSSLPNSPRWCEEPIDHLAPETSSGAEAPAETTPSTSSDLPSLQTTGRQSELLPDASSRDMRSSPLGNHVPQRRALGPKLLLELERRADGKGTVSSPEGKMASLNLELGDQLGDKPLITLGAQSSTAVDGGLRESNAMHSPCSESELAFYTNGISPPASSNDAQDKVHSDSSHLDKVVKWEGAAMFRTMRKAMRLRRRMFTKTLHGAKGIFEAMDLEGTGKLSLHGFAEAMRRLELGLDDAHISQIFEVLDSRSGADHDGLVEYEEFVIEMHKRLTKDGGEPDNQPDGTEKLSTESVGVIRGTVMDVNTNAGFASVLTYDNKQRAHFSNAEVGDPHVPLHEKLVEGDIVVCKLVNSPRRKLRAIQVVKIADAHAELEPESEVQPQPKPLTAQINASTSMLVSEGDRVTHASSSWLGSIGNDEEEEEEDEDDSSHAGVGEANGAFRISESLLAIQDAALRGLESGPTAQVATKRGAEASELRVGEEAQAAPDVLEAAAIQIQATQRARIARQAQRSQFEESYRLQRQENAAVRIQSAHRAKQSRTRVASLRQQAAAAVEEREAASAIRIQAKQRARMARRRQEEQRSAAVRRRQEEQRSAAVRIQRQQRGKHSRRRVTIVRQQTQAAVAERQERSATRIQSTQRGRMMRRDFLQRRQQLQDAREYRRQTVAAVKIQSFRRGQQTRRQPQVSTVDTAGTSSIELVDVISTTDENGYPSILDEAERETRRWLGLDSSDEEEQQAAPVDAECFEDMQPTVSEHDAAVRIQARHRGRATRRCQELAVAKQPTQETQDERTIQNTQPLEQPAEDSPSFDYSVTVVPDPQFGLSMSLEARQSDAVVTGLPCPAVGRVGEAERAGVRVGSVVLAVDGRNVRGGGVNATALAIKMARAGWGGPKPSDPIQIELLLRDEAAQTAMLTEEAQRSKLLAQESAAAIRIQARHRGRQCRREVSTALQQLEDTEQDQSIAVPIETSRARQPGQAAESGAPKSDSVEPRELTFAEQAEALIAALDQPTTLDTAPEAVSSASHQKSDAAEDQRAAESAPDPTADKIDSIEDQELALTQAVLCQHALGDEEWSEDAERLHVAYVRALLQKIYSQHAPSKLPDVDRLMMQWEGDEDNLLIGVRQKYDLTEDWQEQQEANAQVSDPGVWEKGEEELQEAMEKSCAPDDYGNGTEVAAIKIQAIQRGRCVRRAHVQQQQQQQQQQQRKNKLVTTTNQAHVEPSCAVQQPPLKQETLPPKWALPPEIGNEVPKGRPIRPRPAIGALARAPGPAPLPPQQPAGEKLQQDFALPPPPPPVEAPAEARRLSRRDSGRHRAAHVTAPQAPLPSASVRAVLPDSPLRTSSAATASTIVAEDGEAGDNVPAGDEASTPSSSRQNSVDRRTYLAIDKLASFVARHGTYFEEKMRRQYGDDRRYAFLYEGGEGHEYYQQRLAEMKAEST